MFVAYSYHNIYNLIFSRAHDNTLRKLFNDNDKIFLTRFNLTKIIIIIIASLTLIICVMHNLSFNLITLINYYRDLKSSNILIHESRLLLVDFKLLRFKSLNELSRLDF